jgi:hypothetical protein
MEEVAWKEKIMKENAKIEQDLSEEQLQEITGGCRFCEADQRKADLYSAKAQNRASLAESARTLDQPQEAKKHEFAYRVYSRLAQMYQNRIINNDRLRHVKWGE